MKNSLFIVLIIHILISCKSQENLCTSYKSNNRYNQETLHINHADNSFALEIDIGSDIEKLNGYIEFVGKNRIYLKEKSHDLIIEDIDDIKESEVLIAVSVIDSFLIRGTSDKVYPMSVYLDKQEVGIVNLLQEVDTIKVSQILDANYVQINNESHLFYHSVQLPIHKYKGKFVYIKLYRKTSINPDYLKRRIKKGYLKSINGSKFYCQDR